MADLRSLAHKAVTRINLLVQKRMNVDTALRTVLEGDLTRDLYLTAEQMTELELLVSTELYNNTMQQAQKTPATSGARTIAGGRFVSRKSSRYSRRDDAAGASAEDRRDAVADEFRNAADS